MSDGSDLDVARAAWLLIRQHGSDARKRATERARELAEGGDEVGTAVYLRIVKAIGELQRGRGPMDPMH